MRVIILAAGQSNRFKKAGYKTPKPFLKVDWNGITVTMLEHVLNTIPLEFKTIEIAIPPGYSQDFTDKLGWVDQRLINYHILDNTKGPAETALLVMRHITESCLILDTDILNSTNDLIKLTRLNHCGVLVRRSANPAYSYVDRLGEFQRIKEKERISDYAVQGAYFIPRTALHAFMPVLEETVEVMDEPFMSHVFDRLSLLKYAVPTTYTPVDWGTPRDVEMSGAYIMSEREE
jgi:dTDP-glucose pyrophosphorylase